MTGEGLGPGGFWGLEVPKVVGVGEGPRVAGDASVELRSSVGTARVATACALTEAQVARSSSKSSCRP